MIATSVARPYALIRRGGATPGKRPFTRFAFLVEYRLGRGDYKAVLIDHADGRAVTKPVIVEESKIVRQWRERPPPAAIAKAKRGLASTPGQAQSVARVNPADDDVKLSIASIKTVESAGKDRIFWDDDLKGFGLRVTPAGVKTFLIQYRDKRGRSKRFAIGKLGVLTPEEARREARSLLAAVARGEDPAAARQEARQAPSVADLARRYLAEHVEKNNKPSTRKEFGRIVEKIILPALGRAAVADIDRGDIEKLHAARMRTPRSANLALAILSKMFSLAERWKMRTQHANPVIGIERYWERTRTQYLDDAGLAALGKAIDEAERDATIAPGRIAVVKFLLFSGCRLGEALALRWQDLRLAAGELHLPDSKSGARVHPIGGILIGWLAARMREAGDPVAGLVFAGDSPGAPLSNWAIERTWQKLRAAALLGDVRLHDLRRGIGTYGAATGANAFLLRDKLGHKTLSMTQVYVARNPAPLRELSDRVEARIAGAMAGNKAAPIPLPAAKPRKERQG